ncbi:hypothetical protein [Balneatrix alpica]|uniref:hypothetical protein n=1 Tax=Balneatrix alpica TaxID=75684 RepID=UPI002739B247|nr:hypothetical protein [Balneatrix alpica]
MEFSSWRQAAQWLQQQPPHQYVLLQVGEACLRLVQTPLACWGMLSRAEQVPAEVARLLVASGRYCSIQTSTRLWQRGQLSANCYALAGQYLWLEPDAEAGLLGGDPLNWALAPQWVAQLSATACLCLQPVDAFLPSVLLKQGMKVLSVSPAAKVQNHWQRARRALQWRQDQWALLEADTEHCWGRLPKDWEFDAAVLTVPDELANPRTWLSRHLRRLETTLVPDASLILQCRASWVTEGMVNWVETEGPDFRLRHIFKQQDRLALLLGYEP